MKTAQSPKVSIALLTRNSAKTIKGVLDGIMRQDFKDYEIIFIDSSSTDDTVKIAQDYPCRMFTITTAEFGHGKTRNYAAQLARGEFIVFLTHDSVPEKSNWLSELIKPLSDEKVAGVYGRQIPRPNEKTLDKFFQASLYGDKQIIWKNDNWSEGDNLFSDANSALRKSLLLEHPYVDIIVSEDYEWAIRMLGLGYDIVYSPTACVVHSHSYNLHTLFKRNFDVGVSYKTVFKNSKSHALLSKGVQIFLRELKQLQAEGHGLLVPKAIVRDITRFVAIQLGKREQWFSKNFKRKHLSAQGWYWK